MNSLLAADGRKWRSGAGGLGGGISNKVFSSCFLRASLAAAWLLAWSAMVLTPPVAELDMVDGLTAEAPPRAPATPPAPAAAAACIWARFMYIALEPERWEDATCWLACRNSITLLSKVLQLTSKVWTLSSQAATEYKAHLWPGWTFPYWSVSSSHQ